MVNDCHCRLVFMVECDGSTTQRMQISRRKCASQLSTGAFYIKQQRRQEQIMQSCACVALKQPVMHEKKEKKTHWCHGKVAITMAVYHVKTEEFH